jgi:pantoate--beta-alanine ligase
MLAEELFFDIEIVAIDTVREKNGLAMSSRNRLLSDKEKQDAAQLHQALLKSRKKLIDGDSVIAVKDYIKTYFDNSSAIDLEYFEIVDSLSLRNIDKVEVFESVSLCIAGYLGKVRLIDNLSLI